MAADISDLRLRAQRIREFQMEVDGVAFQLRFPARYGAEHLAARHRGDTVALMRELVAESIIGWSGMSVHAIFPEAKADDQVEFSAEAVDLVLQERTDWLQHLGAEIVRRLAERNAQADALRKNSSSGSAGSGPANSELPPTPLDSAA